MSARAKWDRRYAGLAQEKRLEPTPFVAACLPALGPAGPALDVAAGAGRHSLALARQGWTVDAVDISRQGLQRARQRLRAAGLSHRVRFIVADLERPWLPHGHYQLILVSFFLYRPLFPLLRERLVPGGWLVYETFTVDQFLRVQQDTGHPPGRREFYLEQNELRQSFSNFDLVFYDEGEHNGKFTAQLLARKPDGQRLNDNLKELQHARPDA